MDTESGKIRWVPGPEGKADREDRFPGERDI